MDRGGGRALVKCESVPEHGQLASRESLSVGSSHTHTHTERERERETKREGEGYKVPVTGWVMDVTSLLYTIILAGSGSSSGGG